MSAAKLLRQCPTSLLQALASDSPDCPIWLESYFEERDSIKNLNTFERLTLGGYRALREKGAPRALPSMCILTVKKDENLNPLHAKSCIVVLGNHEEQTRSKSECFPLVLRDGSLCYLLSLSIELRRCLK